MLHILTLAEPNASVFLEFELVIGVFCVVFSVNISVYWESLVRDNFTALNAAYCRVSTVCYGVFPFSVVPVSIQTELCLYRDRTRINVRVTSRRAAAV